MRSGSRLVASTVSFGQRLSRASGEARDRLDEVLAVIERLQPHRLAQYRRQLLAKLKPLGDTST
jgi:hypothetical protein